MSRGKKRIEVGVRFGRLVIVSLSRVRERPSGVRVNVWLCACDCGNHTDVFAGNLTNGITKSCGCLQKQGASQRKLKHGKTHTSEYQIWQGMVARCHRRSHASYSLYGGRGIKVCEEWRHSFESFLMDMGTRPSTHHSIDRIDNDGGYCKSNCRWATCKQQSLNKRTNRKITVQGVSRTLSEWSDLGGFASGTIAYRLHTGWPVEHAVYTPARNRNGVRHARVK
jgi:hypothetical protein